MTKKLSDIHERYARVRLNLHDIRVIAAYLGQTAASDDDIENYINAAIRACLEQDACYLKARTALGRIRACLNQEMPWP